jgi:hypothetical protein
MVPPGSKIRPGRHPSQLASERLQLLDQLPSRRESPGDEPSLALGSVPTPEAHDVGLRMWRGLRVEAELTHRR